MTPRTAVALLAASALILAACGSDDSSSTSAPSADDLTGMRFESTSLTGYELVEGSVIELGFESDSLSARAGCNTATGGYSIADGVLEVGALASTLIGCPEPLMAQDAWLSEFLSSGPAISLDSGTLTLTGEDVTIEFAEIEDTELEGTTWVLTATVANQGVSTIPIAAEGQATLTITDGTAAIATGCNSGSTSAEVTESTITFGPTAITLMACEPDLMELETTVLGVLDGEVAYTIDGDNLSIRTDGADGEIGLEFSAAG